MSGRVYVGGVEQDPANWLRVTNVGNGASSIQLADLVAILHDEQARADLFRLAHHATAGRPGNRPTSQPATPATVPITLTRACETCGCPVTDEAAHAAWHAILYGATTRAAS